MPVRQRQKTPIDRGKALILSGPLAVAGVLAVVGAGVHLGAAPDARAQSATVAGDDAHVVAAASLLTSPTIAVRVRVSGGLQELLSERALSVELPEHATVNALLNRLSDAYPVLASMGPSVMVAVGEEMQWPDHVLENGDLIDLVSQMAGG